MIWTSKHPDSIEFFAIDFGPILSDGDSLASLVSLKIVSGDSALVITAVHLEGNSVVATFAAGTDQTVYELEALTTTTQGETLPIVAVLLIRSKLP